MMMISYQLRDDLSLFLLFLLWFFFAMSSYLHSYCFLRSGQVARRVFTVTPVARFHYGRFTTQ